MLEELESCPKNLLGPKTQLFIQLQLFRLQLGMYFALFFFQIKYHRLLENCRISWGNAHKAEQMGYPVSQIICSSCFRSCTNCSMFWHPRLYYNYVYIYIYTPSLFIFWFVVNLIQIFERRQLHTTVESPRLRGDMGRSNMIQPAETSAITAIKFSKTLDPTFRFHSSSIWDTLFIQKCSYEGFLKYGYPKPLVLPLIVPNNLDDFGVSLIFEGSLEVKLPTIWTVEKQRWEESEETRSEERRGRCAKR